MSKSNERYGPEARKVKGRSFSISHSTVEFSGTVGGDLKLGWKLDFLSPFPDIAHLSFRAQRTSSARRGGGGESAAKVQQEPGRPLSLWNANSQGKTYGVFDSRVDRVFHIEVLFIFMTLRSLGPLRRE
jgi:hypothetical protein